MGYDRGYDEGFAPCNVVLAVQHVVGNDAKEADFGWQSAIIFRKK